MYPTWLLKYTPSNAVFKMLSIEKDGSRRNRPFHNWGAKKNLLHFLESQEIRTSISAANIGQLD